MLENGWQHMARAAERNGFVCCPTCFIMLRPALQTYKIIVKKLIVKNAAIYNHPHLKEKEGYIIIHKHNIMIPAQRCNFYWTCRKNDSAGNWVYIAPTQYKNYKFK